jgi:hypothetical protein
MEAVATASLREVHASLPVDPVGEVQLRGVLRLETRGKPEARWQYADQRPGTAIDLYAVSDDPRVASKPPLPGLVRDDHDLARQGVRGDRLLDAEPTSRRGLHLQHLQQVVGHPSGAHALGILRVGEGGVGLVPERQVLEGPVLQNVVLVFGL